MDGEDRDAYLDEVPQPFERERARIANALGDRAHAIEHIGSTAVPGGAAKPSVDVLVIVADPEDEAAFAPALIGAGYELRVREPGHRMFRTPAGDVHVHVHAVADPEVDRHLAGARGPVRPAAPGDADAIAPLLDELGYPTDPAEAGARLTDLLQRDGEGALVYDRDGETVGLLTWQLTHLIYRSAPQLRITALVVRSDQRRRGVATELLAAVEQIASEQGCLRLELTTRPRRADAAALYESAGFEERPRRLVKRLDPR